MEDKNLTSVKNIFLDDEEILWRGSPDKLCSASKAVSGMLILSLFFMIFVAVFAISFIAIAAYEDTGMVVAVSIFLSFFLIPIFVPIVKAIVAINKCKNTIYVITNQRVIIKHGPEDLGIKTIDHSEIHNVTMNATSTEKLKNCGSIDIVTKSSVPINIHSVKNPYDVYKILEEKRKIYSPNVSSFNINDY